MSNSGTIFVVNDDGRLELVHIKPLRREQEWIVALGEVADGATVCSTRLDGAVPGMAVQVVDAVKPVLAANVGADEVVDLVEQIDLATRLERTER